MSQYWDNQAMNYGASQIGTQGGLRGWEMQQPGLMEGAGGYATSGGNTPPAGGDWMSSMNSWLKNSGMMSSTSQDPTTGAVTGNQGWGAPVLGAANGLLSAFMGMKQYGLAKDSLAEGKRQFGLNYDAQRTTTNSQLMDRQRARVASNAGAYQSVGDYMSANSIKGG